ncbi:hypothetical protein M011DRAFT_238189 [Sporormia fimetaria CBS 119925]|uniref:Gamma interferon inducible lysosomal thiol reductase n=1 Tax=Sporormia fimetaria CBS 119925 TaxID=1340428 RepID=A0A6A6VM86_9PLEO|nr:hypothetical protein M011DRAFT_238189 [Sporormia fimetaria CBS 119925]
MDDSKAPLLPQTEHGSETHESVSRPKKRLNCFHAAAFAFVAGLFLFGAHSHCSRPHHSDERRLETKVPLEIHIMSKCPDTRDCLQKLVVPTMEEVSDKVDFRISYIGTANNKDEGVHCKHGQTECLGNILELCAAHEYPDPKHYLGFTMCLSRNYQQIPKKELAEDCALEHGISFDRLNNCMSRDDGAFGMDLLRNSVKRSADLHATTSCTVRLNGKTRCVYNGGKFEDCEGGSKPEDLVRDINKLYK